jgi:chlorobactene glucosyltransferase
MSAASTILLCWYLYNTVMVVYLVLATFLFYARLPKPQTFTMSESDQPLVSVVIPARNEEANIERCLDSFVKQDYAKLEIIVIDDRSTDATGSIIEKFASQHKAIKPLQSKMAPPAGWTGKNNALVQAVEHASGDYILFADADTWHYPDSVRHAVAYAASKKAHLVSFWPLHEFGSLGERLITPSLWSSFFWLDPFQTVNDFSYELAYAVGHAILVDRQAYLRVGGHQAIHEWIIEDHALAMLMKRKGFHIQMADGSKLLKVRMYTSFDSFWHGWSKMLFAVIQYKFDGLFGVQWYVLCSMVFPFVQLAMVVNMWLSGAPQSDYMTLVPLVGIQFAALMAWRARIGTHFERLGWTFLPLLPVSGLILCACYINSAFLVLSGAEVNWKGRKYSVSRLKLPGVD